MATPEPKDVAARSAPPIPHTFFEHVKSFGPGLVVVLTWLGAGDLVDSAVSGGSYGYALMWAMAVVLLARFLLVSIIAKYQLCNERQETVMAGVLTATERPCLSVETRR